MWAWVAIMGLAAIAIFSHSLLHRYLTIKSQKHEPQSQDNNQNKAGCTEQEEMMTNSDGIDGLDDLFRTPFKLIQESLSDGKVRVKELQTRMSNSNSIDVLDNLFNTLFKLIQESISCEKIIYHSSSSNSDPFDDSPWSILIMSDVMEALTDPNTHLIGVYSSDGKIKDAMLRKVFNRVERNNLFGMVVKATVTKRPGVRKIQEDIARQLGFTLNQKSKAKRAKVLIDRIKNEQNILIVLCDVYKCLDLNMVGIPYGVHHDGCKILLTSTSEDVLSNHMHTQKNIRVM